MRTDIGLRLKDERQRLRLDQEPFAAAGGVKLVAQSNYETGKRAPDAEYLAGIAGLGVDVQYVLTGIRTADPRGVSLSAVEKAITAVHGMVKGQALDVNAQQFAGMVLALLPKVDLAEPVAAAVPAPAHSTDSALPQLVRRSQVIVGDSNVQIGRRPGAKHSKVTPHK
jgi:transcriptional regulator with XRE-family HTH domain